MFCLSQLVVDLSSVLRSIDDSFASVIFTLSLFNISISAGDVEDVDDIGRLFLGRDKHRLIGFSTTAIVRMQDTFLSLL